MPHGLPPLCPYLGDGALLEWPWGQGQLRGTPELLAGDLVDRAARFLHGGHQALVGWLQLEGAQGLQGPGLVGLSQVPWGRWWRGWRALTLQQLGLPAQIVLLGLHIGPRDPCRAKGPTLSTRRTPCWATLGPPQPGLEPKSTRV